MVNCTDGFPFFPPLKIFFVVWGKQGPKEGWKDNQRHIVQNLCRHHDRVWIISQSAEGNHLKDSKQGGNTTNFAAVGSTDWRRDSSGSRETSVVQTEDDVWDHGRSWWRWIDSRWVFGGRIDGVCYQSDVEVLGKGRQQGRRTPRFLTWTTKWTMILLIQMRKPGGRWQTLRCVGATKTLFVNMSKRCKTSKWRSQEGR